MTKEDFEEWRQLPETLEFFERLKERRTEIMERWAQGMFTGSSSDETAQLNAHSLGSIDILNDLLETDYDDSGKSN